MTIATLQSLIARTDAQQDARRDQLAALLADQMRPIRIGISMLGRRWTEARRHLLAGRTVIATHRGSDAVRVGPMFGLITLPADTLRQPFARLPEGAAGLLATVQHGRPVVLTWAGEPALVLTPLDPWACA